MKVTASDFGKLIREVVQQEVKRQLPGLIREHLTESYLRKLVTENAPAKTRKVAESNLSEVLSQEEEDEIPEALTNTDEGIYAEHPLAKNEVTSKLLSKNNPLSFIYEGVKPAPRGTGGMVPATEMNNPSGIPLDKIPGLNPEVMRKLAGVGKPTKQTQPQIDHEKERRLQQMRQALEVPGNDDFGYRPE